MSETPLFSVVVPVYNKERYIARCVQSILDQTFSDFEIIIVCDPSSDDSNAVVESFQDKRIRVFYRDQPGPGGYAARNLGIREAKARWIAFLDADDTWNSEHLSNMAAAIRQHPSCDIFAAGWQNTTAGSASYMMAYTAKHLGGGSHALTLGRYMWSPLCVCTNVIVTRKSLLFDVGGFDENRSQGGDMELWFKLFLHSGTGGYWVDYCAATYYRDVDGQVSSNFSLRVSPTAEYIRRIIANNDVSADVTPDELKRFANKRTIGVHRRRNAERKLEFLGTGLSSHVFFDTLSVLERLQVFILSQTPFSRVTIVRDAVIDSLYRSSQNRYPETVNSVLLRSAKKPARLVWRVLWRR